MLYLLYALFFISCVVLVGSVLLQPGKTDAGALFTSNVSSTAFTPRGTASVLAKFTIAAAIVFMLSALILSMPAVTGNVSVLSGNEETPVEATPNTAAPAAEAPPEAANPDGAANPAPASGAPASNTVPAANGSNSAVAVPVQPNPPSNQ